MHSTGFKVSDQKTTPAFSDAGCSDPRSSTYYTYLIYWTLGTSGDVGDNHYPVLWRR